MVLLTACTSGLSATAHSRSSACPGGVALALTQTSRPDRAEERTRSSTLRSFSYLRVKYCSSACKGIREASATHGRVSRCSRALSWSSDEKCPCCTYASSSTSESPMYPESIAEQCKSGRRRSVLVASPVRSKQDSVLMPASPCAVSFKWCTIPATTYYRLCSCATHSASTNDRIHN